MSNLSIYLLLFLVLSIDAQQLQWILLSDGSAGDAPMPRRDAAMGFDSSFLIVYGGRDQSGMPRQDTYAFNILQGWFDLITRTLFMPEPFLLSLGLWEPLNFPNPPSSRYGMASASSLGNGLYVIGGLGMQGASNYYNPYTAYGSGGLPMYRKSPAVSSKANPEVSEKKNPEVSGKQYYPSNPTGYNNYNEDNIDQNYYPLSDVCK